MTTKFDVLVQYSCPAEHIEQKLLVIYNRKYSGKGLDFCLRSPELNSSSIRHLLPKRTEMNIVHEFFPQLATTHSKIRYQVTRFFVTSSIVFCTEIWGHVTTNASFERLYPRARFAVSHVNGRR